MFRFKPQLEELESRLVPSGFDVGVLPVSVTTPPDTGLQQVTVIAFRANDAAPVAPPVGLTVPPVKTV